MAVNYYPLLFQAISRLPSNTRETRREVYARARAALVAQPLIESEIKRELRALERSIRDIEASPYQIPGTRASAGLLVLSILVLKVLWISEPTSMSVYWVIRPWNRHLWVGRQEVRLRQTARKVFGHLPPMVTKITRSRGRTTMSDEGPHRTVKSIYEIGRKPIAVVIGIALLAFIGWFVFSRQGSFEECMLSEMKGQPAQMARTSRAAHGGPPAQRVVPCAG
jgi:hypothetical protein